MSTDAIGNVTVTVTPELDEAALDALTYEIAKRVRVAVNLAIRDAIKVSPFEALEDGK